MSFAKVVEKSMDSESIKKRSFDIVKMFEKDFKNNVKNGKIPEDKKGEFFEWWVIQQLAYNQLVIENMLMCIQKMTEKQEDTLNIMEKFFGLSENQ